MTTSAKRPLLGVVYDIGSAQPVDIFTASRRLCTPVFVLNRAPQQGMTLSSAPPVQLPNTLAGQRSVCDVTGLDPYAAAALLRERGIEHIVTFSERQLLFTAEIAQVAGARFIPVGTALLCRDKLRQRRVLAEAGVDVVRAQVVRGVDDLADALGETGLPAVIKPRLGMGSIDTVRVDSLEQARVWLRGRIAEHAGQVVPEFVVEELLRGDPAQAGAEWGDYVSVESIVEDSTVRHVCVTGKFPLTRPFRETGMVVPSTLGPQLESRVRALVTDAIGALGIDTGVTHTELKLTATGPRIIEVNARLGGYVTDLVRRATGFDLLVAAIRNALGLPVAGLPAVAGRVAYQYFVQPPQHADRLVAVTGADRLSEIGGVRQFEPMVQPGSRVDWRWGTASHIGVVHGEAADHQGVLAAVKDATQLLDIVYGQP